jgi:DNA-binding CsgD family transcriptional regulator
MAEIALGDFNAARATLDGYIAEPEDAYCRVIVSGARLRLVIAARSDEAVEIISDSLAAQASRATHAEYLATLALWCACRGDFQRATECLVRCRSMSASLEPRTLATSAAAVLRLSTGRPYGRSVRRLARLAVASDCWEPLVCAVRGHYPLLEALLESGEPVREALERIATECEDGYLARCLGIRLARGGAFLTPREREVHALLGEGLTNKEIAQRLFIAESTAKVHVRRVMEKLGAQTRTAAALRFVRER